MRKYFTADCVPPLMFLVLIMAIGAFSCNLPSKNTDLIQRVECPPCDTVRFDCAVYERKAQLDSVLASSLVRERDSLIRKTVRMRVIQDSLRTGLGLANFKLEKIKFYNNLCLRKPTNDKFLKGWVRITLDEK